MLFSLSISPALVPSSNLAVLALSPAPLLWPFASPLVHRPLPLSTPSHLCWRCGRGPRVCSALLFLHPLRPPCPPPLLCRSPLFSESKLDRTCGLGSICLLFLPTGVQTWLRASPPFQLQSSHTYTHTPSAPFVETRPSPLITSSALAALLTVPPCSSPTGALARACACPVLSLLVVCTVHAVP